MSKRTKSNGRRKRGTATGDGAAKLTTKQLQKAVLQLFRDHPGKRFTPKQIIQQLGLKNNKDAVRYAIQQLQADGRLKTVEALKLKGGGSSADTSRAARTHRKREDAEAARRGDVDYSAPRRGRGAGRFAASFSDSGTRPPQHGNRPDDPNGREGELVGRVDLSRSGSGYIVVDGREQDIFVPQRRLAGAMNGDTVRIRYWTPRNRKKPEGEVTEVLQRKVTHFLGTYRDGRKYGVVLPDRLEYEFDIAVMPGEADGAKDGDKVVVEVTQWPERAGRTPRGRVTQVLGATGTTDLEMKGILVAQGFQLKHDDAALEESDAIPETISPQEAHRRLDLRDVLTFTIDPHDAKDFDDAISYRRLDNGRLEIGVHIADVSHYVKPGSALDREAARSTTSVYLVDRVLPMLPEKLSNGVCSLRPHEDKCTFSAMFEFDEHDKIRRTYFAKTLTHSDRRFTYDGAQQLIEADPKDLRARGEDAEADWTDVIHHVNHLAGRLRSQRFRDGAIDFDADEVRFRLDAEGRPVDAYVKQRRAANMLIEDFMLLANRSVAEFIARKGAQREIPFPYRVHDQPDPDKMASLAAFAAKLGVKLDLSSPKQIQKSYNRLRKLAAEKPELAVLSPLAIRTMAKAEYTTDNIGHYGLAFEHYTHFTSPIRRYADVLVHRILEQNLGPSEYRVDKAELEDHCRHISERERAAVKAERESTSYFQVLYIRDHIGEDFVGAVSGVIERGVFVTLEANYCEGFVPFHEHDERFDLDAHGMIATGRRTGRKLQMGTAVRVRVVSADPESRRIEFALLEGTPTREDLQAAKDRGAAKVEGFSPQSPAAGDTQPAAKPAAKKRGGTTRRKPAARKTATAANAGAEGNGAAKSNGSAKANGVTGTGNAAKSGTSRRRGAAAKTASAKTASAETEASKSDAASAKPKRSTRSRGKAGANGAAKPASTRRRGGNRSAKSDE